MSNTEKQPSKTATKSVASIKFRTAGKNYDFLAPAIKLSPGDRVIVETDRGRALGILVSAPVEKETTRLPDGMKRIIRKASENDLIQNAKYKAREQEAQRFCKRRIIERKMVMKMVRAEYLFDGSKIIFYFTADGRIDFRDLVKDLAHHFHTRIEMRQIGVRDEAKMTGGLGVCGRELCCSTFLRKFEPVSVKMAKEQGIALNPTKISGQCGRLLCCLGYEYKTYCSLKKGLPKCGKRIQVHGEEAEVVDVNVLTRKITVRTQDRKQLQFDASELDSIQKEPVGEKQAATRQKPQAQKRPQTKDRDRSSRDKKTASAPSDKVRTETAKDGQGTRADQKPRRRKPRKRPEGSMPQAAITQATKDGATGEKKTPSAQGDRPVSVEKQANAAAGQQEQKARRRRPRRKKTRTEK